MGKQLFANNAKTTINGSLTNGGTTVTVSSGAGTLFPTPTGGNYFLATLFEKDLSGVETRVEVVKVTGRTGDTLTIVRDVESITGFSGGYSYPSTTGVTVYLENRLTAGGVGSFLQSDDIISKLDATHAGTGGTAHADATTSVSGFMSAADKTKLDGVAAGATNYTHPANHPASVITQDASNRFVTDAEKTTWNGKQAALVSGTSIKTVNSNSLLGSGDVAVQATLVSGTNIKTVNSTSLLGSGDVAVQATLVSGTNIKTVNGTTLLGSGNITTGDATLAGNQTFTGTNTFTGIGETQYSLTGTDIAVSNGTIQYKTLASNTTFTESLADGQSVVLMLNPSTFTVTWPATTWIGSTASAAPTLVASVYNCIVFFQMGGTLFGRYVGRV